MGIKDPKSYSAAYLNGWLVECSDQIPTPSLEWGLDDCIEEAKKHPNMARLKKKTLKCYRAIRRNRWEAKMVFAKDSGDIMIKWTLELCQSYAKKYETKSKWSKGHIKSYNAASRHRWISECSQHMVSERSSKNKILRIKNVT